MVHGEELVTLFTVKKRRGESSTCLTCSATLPIAPATHIQGVSASLLLWELWKRLLRCAQRCVPQMIPNQVTWKVNINYHRRSLGSLWETPFGEDAERRASRRAAWGKGALVDLACFLILDP